ncbi:MAG TPA: tyrosine--tRNA ligase [Anaerolineae bacterium]|nr:tyrosine--tRNA ligase [Anaerolineae bacterium]
MLSIDEQVALLMQGTEYGDAQLKQNMARDLKERLIESQKEQRPLRVYCGFDPRTSDLHLGHTIPMRKLRQFQELGHDITFLVGNYTSLIGDPSDKDKLRPQLTADEVAHNSQTYAEQAYKILDRTKTRVRHNAEWLSELSFADLIKIASNFTVQQFLQRENFKLRMERNDPIYLHETFYALMQAYDAVAQNTDVQVGGSDQLFNIVVAGRKLQEAMGQKPQVAIIMGILPGTDGVVKMSKSLGNHIPILSTPEDMYGKVMSVPDAAMPAFFKLVTRFTPHQIEAIEKGLADGSQHPRDVKMELAREIVSIFHGAETVKAAEQHFINVFQQREIPDEMDEIKINKNMTIADLLISTQFAKSKNEARRLIDQGGVKIDGIAINDALKIIEVNTPQVLQVGKRKFVRLMPNS